MTGTKVTMSQGQELMDKKWELLKTRAIKEPAIVEESEFANQPLPEWFDSTKLRKSQSVCLKHFASVNFSHLCGLLIGLQIPEALFPLITTKKSESIPSLFNRYLSTILHVRTWYEGDLFHDEKAVRSVRHVRSLHRKIMKKLNNQTSDESSKSDESNNNNNGDENFNYPAREGRLWLNQFDMVATQWAFIGLLLWAPERCGMDCKKDREDLCAIMYTWRCLGYFMGIRDEYNLCSESDDYESTRYLCNIILNEVYVPNMAPLNLDPQPMGYRMALDIVTALAPTLPSPVNGNVFIHYWTVYFDTLNKTSVPTLDCFWDYFAYFFMVFEMQFMLTFQWFKKLIKSRIFARIDSTAKNRKEIIKEYQIKYPEIRFSSEDFKATEFKEYQDFFAISAEAGNL